jgi:hypothetical protein
MILPEPDRATLLVHRLMVDVAFGLFGLGVNLLSPTRRHEYAIPA